jgi:hypothetical protein
MGSGFHLVMLGSALKRLRKPGEERSTPSSSKKNSAPADEQDFNMQLLQMYYGELIRLPGVPMVA